MTVAGILIMASGLLILALTSVPPVTQRLRGGIFYGWWAIALAATVMILSIVPFFHSMTAWFVVLERQFGWKPHTAFPGLLTLQGRGRHHGAVGRAAHRQARRPGAW